MAERESIGTGEPKPEADAIEQAQPLLDSDLVDGGGIDATGTLPLDLPPDVPEADALDQARVVPIPPDDEMR